MATHEYYDHTADVGLRVHAATLDELFAEAGRGLCQLIVPNLTEVRAARASSFELASDSLDDLLCDWLSELLFMFETQGLVFSRFHVEVDQDALSLRAEAEGETVDGARHQSGCEIKAVTYHQLRVQRTDSGWLAEVILDI